MAKGGEPTPTPKPLDYAPSPRWWHRGRVVVALVMTVLLVLGGIGAWRWGPTLRHRINLLQVQRPCMNYVAPPDRVVFTTHPEEVDALLNSDLPYRRGHQDAMVNVGVDALKYAWYSAGAYRPSASCGSPWADIERCGG